MDEESLACEKYSKLKASRLFQILLIQNIDCTNVCKQSVNTTYRDNKCSLKTYVRNEIFGEMFLWNKDFLFCLVVLSAEGNKTPKLWSSIIQLWGSMTIYSSMNHYALQLNNMKLHDYGMLSFWHSIYLCSWRGQVQAMLLHGIEIS